MRGENGNCVEFKKGKKEQKIKKWNFAKKTFSFLRVYELDIVLGVNADRKNRMGKVCSRKICLNFRNQLRCPILEISSYAHARAGEKGRTAMFVLYIHK